MKKIFPLLLSFSFSFSVLAVQSELDVIYGEDNRKDVFESTDSVLVELSRSTAALINKDFLKASGSEITIVGKILEERGICKKERFSQQLSVASCSGFLVSENLLVTAGHCVKSDAACAAANWVFDYKLSSENSAITIPNSNVYKCKRIVTQALNPISKTDYAVIELDRKVPDRAPLSFRRTGKVSVGAELAVIGHPTGLPLKITDQGKVRRLETNYFVTNLDTYHGNSGSAVINTRTAEVEGILVRGDNDYVKERSGCQISKVCAADGCRGEDVSYISTIGALKDLK